MPTWRFKVVFDKVDEELSKPDSQESAEELQDLMRETDEIAELKKLALEISESQDRSYTST
jgi:hypothetical protein